MEFIKSGSACYKTENFLFTITSIFLEYLNEFHNQSTRLRDNWIYFVIAFNVIFKWNFNLEWRNVLKIENSVKCVKIIRDVFFSCLLHVNGLHNAIISIVSQAPDWQQYVIQSFAAFIWICCLCFPFGQSLFFWRRNNDEFRHIWKIFTENRHFKHFLFYIKQQTESKSIGHVLLWLICFFFCCCYFLFLVCA